MRNSSHAASAGDNVAKRRRREKTEAISGRASTSRTMASISTNRHGTENPVSSVAADLPSFTSLFGAADAEADGSEESVVDVVADGVGSASLPAGGIVHAGCGVSPERGVGSKRPQPTPSK